MTDPNAAHALSVQEKYELYFLGLAFTVLGLSIQTAKFDGPPAQQIAELIGWGLLLVSGIVGLLRMRWVPNYFRVEAKRREWEKQIAQARTVPIGGQIKTNRGVISPEQFIARREANIENLDEQDTKIARRINRMQTTQTWGFVAGVVAIAVSRAFVPVAALVTALPR